MKDMKRITLLLTFMIVAVLSASAADKVVKLPKHNLKLVKATVAETYANRHSVREFSEKELDLQDLSNLLWAANGINRPAEHKRTAPSAMNRQEVDVYVVNKGGIYLYNPDDETLILKVEGDKRDLVAGRQKFAQKAPVSILLSTDVAKLNPNNDIHAQYMAVVDAGIVTENICLYCAAANLANVPRATMDAQSLKQLLGLADTQLLIMNIPVGYFVDSAQK
jgi:SagB-type dehydrogenase family enzyme